MTERIANLAPTFAFIPTADYAHYFTFSATVLLFLIPSTFSEGK